MTISAVAFTDVNLPKQAGESLALQINKEMQGHDPDVVIVFASSAYDYSTLLKTVKQHCKPRILVGSSSAGEFTSAHFGTDCACAIGIYSDEIKFSAGLAQGITNGRQKVADDLHKALASFDNFEYQYHSAMIFADALSGYTDELIEILTEKTVGKYQFFGGGAGDNANFMNTHVFFDTEAHTDASVILEILSNKPVGIGTAHNWKPISKKMRVTEVDGRRLISLNARPATELFMEHAETTGQSFDLKQPIPYFLHNILGMEIAGGYKLRAPLGIDADGAVILASDLPVGAYVTFMGTDSDGARRAAMDAAESAVKKLQGNKPSVALFFDCVATRLRMGKAFDFELAQINETLDGTNYVGCNTYGQVARVEGQFSGFQNCTAIVCVIPD